MPMGRPGLPSDPDWQWQQRFGDDGSDPANPPFLVQLMVTRQSVRRRATSVAGRDFPIRPHLARPIVGAAAPTTPVAPAVVVTEQSRLRSTLQRSVPRPHLAPPNLTQPPQPPLAPGTFVHVATTRPSRFRAPLPHLPPRTLAGPTPVPPARIESQALTRSYLQRRVPKPHLSPPNLTPPVAPPVGGKATYLNAALVAARRVRVARQVTWSYLADVAPTVPPLVTRAIYVNQVGASARRLRQPRQVTTSYLADIAPVVPPNPPGTFHYQALFTPRFPRTVPPPHVAEPNLASEPLLLQFHVSRGADRFPRNAPPRPHLAAPVISTGAAPNPPVARGTFHFVTNRFARPDAPHLPPPTLLATPPYFGTSTFVRNRFPQPPRPHLAPSIKPLPLPPGSTTHYQALARPYFRRTTPRPHLAPPNLAPSPFRPATVVTQAHERPLTRRTIFHPHLAPPDLTQPASTAPVPYGTFVRQATKTATMLRRRDIPEPHIADPIVNPAPPAPQFVNRWLMHRRRSIRGGTARPLRSQWPDRD